MLVNLLNDNMRLHDLSNKYQEMAIADKKRIFELEQEIESLKCCGNCKHYLTVINEGRCFEGIKDIYRYDPNAKSASGDEVCDKWQKL